MIHIMIIPCVQIKGARILNISSVHVHTYINTRYIRIRNF